MFTCLHCGTGFEKKKSTYNKFCTFLCSTKYKKEQHIKDWLSNNLKGWSGKTRQLKRNIREWLFEQRGAKCEECGWDKKHPADNRPLVEIDHIDGNAENCAIENLRILCPNCHSMTSTYRARNKNSKRNRKAE